LYVAGPAHDEGDADAAFVGGALEAAQQGVAVEEGGVGAAFLVGALSLVKMTTVFWSRPFSLSLASTWPT